MVATSFIVQLAFLPCLVLGSSLLPRAKEFDYDSLTLREVGARNTLVSRLQWLIENVAKLCRTGVFGWRRMGSLFPSGMIFHCTLRRATIASLATLLRFLDGQTAKSRLVAVSLSVSLVPIYYGPIAQY